ncbi:MAG: hypothetical protein J1F31_00290 [Erysipelotrichales bacterium]|nr:hypothetical protein [Erysipelotrichales bacterium]
MINADDLLEPRKTYARKLKDLHHKNSEDYFDELVKKSGINVEENKQTIKKLNSVNEERNKLKSQKNKFASLKVFLIVLIILFFLGIVIDVIHALYSDTLWLNIVVGIIMLGAAIGFIFLLSKNILKKLKLFNAELETLDKEAAKLLEQAYMQMNPLNALYGWNICTQISNKSCPLIELDRYFNPRRYEYLHECFGFSEEEDENISTVFVQSGSILGNPFLFQKRYIQEMVDKSYTGSIVITWTTSHYSNGKWETRHHSQTLTATIYRPAPIYYLDTWLIYGNEAAPNLSFSRKPSNANSMNEKAINKYVKSQDKVLDKMVEKDIDDKDGNGSQFTRLANTKFEALFHALDRNNEVEFRLLFTPLAQKNMLDLIENKEPYGDDFSFIKKKKINYIKSGHIQHFDLTADPKKFVHYDYEFARNNFTKINDEYFKNIFFDFAPLISIPLYQQHKPKEYIYKDNYPSNITKFEHEVLANAFNHNQLKHPESTTDTILKARAAYKEGERDIVNIDAHSFKAIPRVEYVSKMGGDGRMHMVPVNYYEYLPLKQTTSMVAQYESDNSQININNDIIKQRGLLAYLNKAR